MSGLESHVGKEIDLSDIGHPRLLESISAIPAMLYLAFGALVMPRTPHS